ncbi:MAG: hypothetical protein WBF43_12035 [Methylocella sp.]
MTKPERLAPPSAAPDDETTMTAALEPSGKQWARASFFWGKRHGVLPLMPSFSKDDGETTGRRSGERNGQLTPRG